MTIAGAIGMRRAIGRDAVSGLRQTLDRKLPSIHHDVEIRQQAAEAELDDALDDHIGDDLLRLMFTACHPALSIESRVALTLRCLGGLNTEEIARAFLIPEATAAQRIVRAKKTLRQQGVGFELPTPEQTRDRLQTVLQVVYLIFNEGLRRQLRTGLDPARSVRRSAPSRPRPRRPAPRRGRGPRLPGATRATGRADPGTDHRRGRRGPDS